VYPPTLRSAVLILRSVQITPWSVLRTLFVVKKALRSVFRALQRAETKNALVGDTVQGVRMLLRKALDLLWNGLFSRLLEENTHFVFDDRQSGNLVGVLLDGGVDFQRLVHGITGGRYQSIPQTVGKLVDLIVDRGQSANKEYILFILSGRENTGKDVGVSGCGGEGFFDERGISIGCFEKRSHLIGIERDEEIKFRTNISELLKDIELCFFGEGSRDQVLSSHGELSYIGDIVVAAIAAGEVPTSVVHR